MRVTRALDSHAWAIHESAYDDVMAVVDAHGKRRPAHALASDQFVAELHQKVPTYACYPNLAWQSIDESDLTGTTYSLYGKTGHQKIHPSVTNNLLTECVAPEATEKPPKLALLFLTRGEVHHAGIWKEWVAQAPDQVGIYSHPKQPEEIKGGFLDGTAIPDFIPTEWGKVSLVRASIALIREALKDPKNTHFVLLSESCLPIQPLSRILLRLQHDGRTRFGFRGWDKSSETRKDRSRAAPAVPMDCWRFHQQWWLLDRTAAVIATRNDHTAKFEEMFASDEGYFGTALMLEGYPVDDLVYSRDVTWTHWEREAGSPTNFSTITPERLCDLLDSDCFFARKFPKGADIGQYGLHR